MRSVILVFSVVVLISSCSTRKSVTIEVRFQKQYCGGARPTKQIEKTHAEFRPYAGKTMILAYGNGKRDSLKTDSAGRIKADLKVGVYRLYETWRYYRKAPGNFSREKFDRQCLENEWNQHHMLITVRKDGFEISDSAPIVEYCEWRAPCRLVSADDHVPE